MACLFIRIVILCIGLFTRANVLEIFNANLFTFYHTFNFISSLFTDFSISCSFDDSKNIFVLLSNGKNLSLFHIFGNSLISYMLPGSESTDFSGNGFNPLMNFLNVNL